MNSKSKDDAASQPITADNTPVPLSHQQYFIVIMNGRRHSHKSTNHSTDTQQASIDPISMFMNNK